MLHESKKRQSTNLEIKLPEEVDSQSIETIPHLNQEKVAISFRHFQRSHECFSDWDKNELKRLSKWIEKISCLTIEDIKHSDQCHAHNNSQSKPPDTVSEDVRIYSLKVTKKARVHGFFFNNDFFLIWLDRNHRVLK